MKFIKSIKNKAVSEKDFFSKLIPNFFELYNKNKVILNNQCTELEINTNALTTFIIKDLLPIVGVSPYPITEQLLMVAAVTKFKPDYIFEWGTHLGISARIFYEISKKHNLNTCIHSIDLPDDVDHIEHPRNRRGIKVQGIDRVTLHQGDGLKKSIEIANGLKKENKLLFFLDGDHEYDSVIRELNGIYNSFPQAIILLHDTFYQSAKSNYNIGPYKAIQTFINNHPSHYKILSTNLGLPGMTLLYTNHE